MTDVTVAPEDAMYNRVIHAACREALEPGVDPGIEYTPEARRWRLSVSIPLDGGTGPAEESFWVEFQAAPTGYTDDEYLVMTVWLTADYLAAGREDNGAALVALDGLNGEPGVKCRLDLDPNGGAWNWVVVEADLPREAAGTVRAVQAGLERLIAFVRKHYQSSLRPYLQSAHERRAA